MFDYIKLRNVMSDRSLTVRKLAADSDLSPAVINRYRQGECRPSVPALVKISRALHMQPQEFLIF